MNKNWWQRLRPDQQLVIMELGVLIFGIVYVAYVGWGIFNVLMRYGVIK